MYRRLYPRALSPATLRTLFYAACLALAGAAPLANSAEQTSGLPARSGAETGATAAPDTLRFRVRAGDVFIAALPALPDTTAGGRYVLAHAPALSWLVDRSFFWRTMPGDGGEHVVRLAATYPDAPADTLILSIRVDP